MSEKLVEYNIKKRVDTYYLISKTDLGNLKAHSVAGDLCFLVASLALGFYLDKGDGVLLTIGLIALGVSLIFYYLRYSLIQKTTSSGNVEDFSVKAESYREKLSSLTIIKATYGTTADKMLDVNDELNAKIKNNRLVYAASNTIAGDPDPGTVKYLEVEYEYGGTNVAKKYKEGDIVTIP